MIGYKVVRVVGKGKRERRFSAFVYKRDALAREYAVNMDTLPTTGYLMIFDNFEQARRLCNSTSTDLEVWRVDYDAPEAEAWRAGYLPAMDDGLDTIRDYWQAVAEGQYGLAAQIGGCEMPAGTAFASRVRLLERVW
jgi:hypothetical protein